MDKDQINKDTFIRYLLTIGFILLIFIVLFLFLILSRFVFSDTTLLGEHVKTTQNLLEDIDSVEKTVILNPTNITKINTEEINYGANNNLNNYLIFEYANITSINYLNINENKSIISLVLDKKIEITANNIYYFKIENLTTLKKGEIIVYNNTEPKLAEFVEFKDEIAFIKEKNLDKTTEIYKFEILGKVFLNQNK